jgi:hypothetical protein
MPAQRKVGRAKDATGNIDNGRVRSQATTDYILLHVSHRRFWFSFSHAPRRPGTGIKEPALSGARTGMRDRGRNGLGSGAAPIFAASPVEFDSTWVKRQPDRKRESSG